MRIDVLLHFVTISLCIAHLYSMTVEADDFSFDIDLDPATGLPIGVKHTNRRNKRDAVQKEPHVPCKEVICPEAYDPVCGRKGVTYKNYCQMVCKYKDRLSHKGECSHKAGNCFCQISYDPVCGVNGKTYINKCRMRCDRMKLNNKGACRPEINKCKVQETRAPSLTHNY